MSKPSQRLSIYLAGKIHKNDWRHDIIGHKLKSVWGSDGGPVAPEWPVIQGGVLGAFDYVGPYFMSDDHGCGHGPNTHGCGFDADGICAGAYPTPGRPAVRDLCLAAIDRADIVFAWLNDHTAYGTLVEVGYARGRGKRVVIATPVLPAGTNDVPEAMEDLWFAFACATTITAETPAKALETFAEPLLQLESPIEERFWSAYLALKPAALAGMKSQVRALNGRYRLDFGIPGKKVGIELDGYAWHSSPEAFTRDRARQRDLEAAGWRIIRFSGSEITTDVEACVRQAAALVERFKLGNAG